MVAHAICGSSLWRVERQSQSSRTDAITESVESSPSEGSTDFFRREALAMLGMDEEEPTVVGGGDHIVPIFVKLLSLSDRDVLAVLAVVMAETLQSATTLIELLGSYLEVDMAQCWEADEALLDLIRDKEILGVVLADVAGADAAAANAKETGKVQRGVIADCLAGAGGRDKRTGWVPRWMQFPPSAYTARGGVATVDLWTKLQGLLEPEQPDDPQTPGDAEVPAIATEAEASEHRQDEEGDDLPLAA
nr:hypothetical protein [Sphingomonas sp. CDS-1]